MKMVIILLVLIMVLVAGVLGYFTVKEFNPAFQTFAPIENQQERILDLDSSFTITSWNIGYASLGEEADFFMDGGKMSLAVSEDIVKNHLKAITSHLEEKNSDFVIIQEIDSSSKRSFFVDQISAMKKSLKNRVSIFAPNFDVEYVIVPFTNPMGKVYSGLMTLSNYKVTHSSRYALPGNYSWPTRIMHLKRAMTDTRMKVGEEGKELVILNTHNSVFDKSGFIRKEQLGFIKEFLLREYNNGNYVIIGGDWNHVLPGVDEENFAFTDAIPEWSMSIADDYMPDEWSWGVDVSVPSLRANGTPYTKGKNYITVLDGFLVSPNIEIEMTKTDDLGFKHSDHQPVTMRFKFKK